MQLLLRRNADVLSEHVALFPKHVSTRNLRNRVNAYLVDRSEPNLQALQGEVSNIVAEVERSGNPVAIVSDEYLCGCDLDNPGDDPFENTVHILQLIERAAQPARSEFVFYIRDFDAWLRSNYNQSVKAGRSSVEFAEWVDAIPVQHEWNTFRKQLIAATEAPVHFVPMEDEIASGKPLGTSLLQFASVPTEVVSSMKLPPQRNESLSPGALQFMLNVNKSDLNGRSKRLVRRMVASMPEVFV